MCVCVCVFNFKRDLFGAILEIFIFLFTDQKEAIPRHAATLGSYNNATCANDNDPVAIVFEQFCSANTFQVSKNTETNMCVFSVSIMQVTINKSRLGWQWLT